MHTNVLLEDHSNDLLGSSYCNLDLILVMLPRILKRELVTKHVASLVHITGRTNEKVWWRGKLLLVNGIVIHREHELFQFYNGFVDCIWPWVGAKRKTSDMWQGNESKKVG